MYYTVKVGVERPIHLLHEIVLHFDLVITWESIDAVTSYRFKRIVYVRMFVCMYCIARSPSILLTEVRSCRLSENNSRYGTTTFVLPPDKVLHADLMENDPAKIKDAVLSKVCMYVCIILILNDLTVWYVCM